MTRRSTTLSLSILLLCLLQLPVLGASRSKETSDSPDISDRLLRVIRRVVTPIVRILDDVIVVPKP